MPVQQIWRARKDIPNQNGFRVVALLDNERVVVTEVVFESGTFKLRDVPIDRVLCWKAAQAGIDIDLGSLHNTYQLAEEPLRREEMT